MRTSAPPRPLARRLPLVLLLALVAALHAVMFALEPEVRLFEDEPHYNQYAFLDAIEQPS